MRKILVLFVLINLLGGCASMPLRNGQKENFSKNDNFIKNNPFNKYLEIKKGG